MTHPNIIAGALREAVVLYGLDTPNFDPYSEDDCEYLRSTFNLLLAIALEADTADPGVAATQANVVHQFPGTEVQQPQPAAPPVVQTPGTAPPPQQLPQGVPPQQQAPAGNPGQVHQLMPGADADTKWANLLTEMAGRMKNGNTQSWYDNRLNKRSQNSPDFRHKTLDDPPNRSGKVWKMGLYLKDAPPWALQALQQYPPVQPDPQYQQAPQQFQQPPPNQPVQQPPQHYNENPF